MDSTNFSELRLNLQVKKDKLDSACTTLKTEFFGIDRVIDQLVESVSAWYFFPDLQDKPVIINLWGMTGVGKTSLLKRLFELLDLSDVYHRFDMGAESSGGAYWGDSITDFLRDRKGGALIIAFDEFQHSRTIDELKREKVQKDLRVFWELVDSGKLMISSIEGDTLRLNEYYFLIQNAILNYQLKAVKGLIQKDSDLSKRITSGLLESPIVRRRNDFYKLIHKSQIKKVENSVVPYLIPDEYLPAIQRVSFKTFATLADIRKYLSGLNEIETLTFIEKIIKDSSKPVIFDYSKALILVLGNIDEVYDKAGDMSPDLNADEYYKETIKISITDVKRALKDRFRNEQIARLGNNHIIYPSLNSNAYYKIIEKELKGIATKIQEVYSINITFDQSVNEIVYREGVCPAQGTRPVFTSIYQLVKCNLNRAIYELLKQNIHSKQIEISYANENLIVNFISGYKVVNTYSVKITLNVESRRSNRKDDLQAIIAVHEGGHAAILAILLRILPESIKSVTADSITIGYVESSMVYDSLTRPVIINYIATMLGGYAAEKLIFGEDHITAGSQQDITSASKIAMRAIKDYGFGNIPISMVQPFSECENLPRDYSNSFQKQSEELIMLGLELAEVTLKEHRALLLTIADHLSDNQGMDKDIFRKIFSDYMNVDPEKYFISNCKNLYYREKLKQAVKEQVGLSNDESKVFKQFSLNYSQDDTETLK